MEVMYVLIVIFLLIIGSAFASSSEIAFLSIKPISIKQYSKSSNKRQAKKAKRVLKIHDNFSMFLTTILVLNNIFNVLIASLSTYLFTSLLSQGQEGVLLASAASSIIVIIFGEIIPKTLARIAPEKLTMAMSGIIYFFMLVIKPISFVFGKLEEFLNKKFGKKEITATENELIDIVETIEREGVIEHSESKLIQSAITFDDITVRIAMKPKEEVIYINKDISFEELAKIFYENNYSRLPVYDGELNTIVGIIHQRDVYDTLFKKEEKDITELMKEPLYLSQRKLLSDTLESLQMNKSHLAIVVDNLKNKNFMGIITLEDILEELVGEIYDEYDETPKHFFEIGNHLYHVGGKALLSEFFEEYLEDSKKPRTKAKTISEWILELAGRVRKNDVIYYDNLKMTILDKDKKVIKMIEVEEMTDYAEE